jgi:hypothetical protein
LSIYSPPDLSAAIVELFLSTIRQARIYAFSQTRLRKSGP